MLLQDKFLGHALATPDRLALIDRGARISYAQLLAQTQSIAADLRSRGVVRGDRVALLLNNSVEFVAAFYASLLVGAVAVPINPMTKSEKLVYLLNDAQASVLLTEAALRRAWEPAEAHCRSVQTVVLRGEGSVLSEIAGGSQALTPKPAIDQDLAALIYTSGSTGFAKGVMLTHLNMVSARDSILSYLALGETDLIYCALPLSFDYGLYQVLMAHAVGAAVALSSSFSLPAENLRQMAQLRATVLPGVPTMFSMLLKVSSLESYDLSALRIITNTAAALSERRLGELRARFPQARLFSMYGLTECKRVTYLPPEQLDERPTSVGRGMPNQELWLVDEAGRRLPCGSIGELVIRGSHVMRGYWRAPEETARRLRDGPVPGERILYSGDIFRTDAEGWLYFVARKDDIIKSRGEKVSPREVESVIYSLDGVREVAVVGVDDELLGQAIKAFVEPHAHAKLTERQVIAHCLSKLENFMVPKFVEIVRELPRTDTGKVHKSGLNGPYPKPFETQLSN